MTSVAKQHEKPVQCVLYENKRDMPQKQSVCFILISPTSGNPGARFAAPWPAKTQKLPPTWIFGHGSCLFFTHHVVLFLLLGTVLSFGAAKARRESLRLRTLSTFTAYFRFAMFVVLCRMNCDSPCSRWLWHRCSRVQFTQCRKESTPTGRKMLLSDRQCPSVPKKLSLS